MSWDEFEKKVIVLPEDVALYWRARFVEVFIDADSVFYKKHIHNVSFYAGGPCYDGYLWDCLKNFEAIKYDQLREELANQLGEVMVLWDLHSAEKIPIPGYWRFPRNSVLVVDPKVLIQNLEYLPEDIYIFTEQLTWTLITTHEYTDNNCRICARATRAD